MDGDGTKDIPAPRNTDDVVRVEGAGFSALALSHEQEMALQQIIESNHMRQLRSTSPLPISGAHCLGASAPPNHSDDGQNAVHVGPPCFPTGGALWRGLSGSPPNLASTWNSYHGYGPSNSAGASASSSLSRRGCATTHFASMSASGLSGTSTSSAALTGNASFNNVSLLAHDSNSGRDSPGSSTSSSFNVPIVPNASGGPAVMSMQHAPSSSGVHSSGVNSLGLLDAAVVAELERTSLQSLVSCVDAAMSVGSGARTMDAAVVAELERTSLHSLVSVMDASMHMHQATGVQNSPRVVNRQWATENSPSVSSRPKLPTPSRAIVSDSHGSGCSSHTLPPHARFSPQETHRCGRGDGPAGNVSSDNFAASHGNLVHATSETASTDSSESNMEMQVTRSGEQSRQFVVSRSPRVVTVGTSGLPPGESEHVADVRDVVQRGDPAATFSSISTPVSPCKIATPATSDLTGGAAAATHQRRREDLCEAMAEMSTSCPIGAFDANSASFNGSVKQKCKMLMKRKGKCGALSSEGGEPVVSSCLGGDAEAERVSLHRGVEDRVDGPSTLHGRSQIGADTSSTAGTKNHGYAAPLQTDDKTPVQKVTSPALPQTPPPAIGSSNHLHFQNGDALATTSNVQGGAQNHGGGAKAKLKHFTAFFSRGRRRGKGISVAAVGCDGEPVSCDHAAAAAAAAAEDHQTRRQRSPIETESSLAGRGDCGVCQACTAGGSNASNPSDAPLTTAGKPQQRSVKCSASSKLISTVVGHLTGSPVRRPSAHAAAPPGRQHPHLLDSCWGRVGGMTASASRDHFSSSAMGAETDLPVNRAVVEAMANRPRQPLPNALPFSETTLAPFTNFSAALLSTNPSIHAITTRPHLFRHLQQQVGGAAIPGQAIDEDVARGLPPVSSAAGIALTSETQKSEYGSLGPDGRLIPRTVHTQIDYMHHLVNDLKEISACSFYWGVMDRYEAERLLDNKPEGTFLLRDSAQEDFLFSVSFRRYGRSLHARIEQWQHKFSFDALDPGVFSSDTVCGLIEHYKDPSCCMFFEPMLTIPLNRSFVFSLQHLCRATICKNLTYDGINLLQLPNVSKDYLKYYHYKQKIRERRYETNVSQ